VGSRGLDAVPDVYSGTGAPGPVLFTLDVDRGRFAIRQAEGGGTGYDWVSGQLRRRWGRLGQCGDARGEQAPHLILFAGIETGQHVLLDAANRGAGRLELAAPAGGQLGGQGPACGCLCRADDESLAFEGLQEHVHRLPGYEGAAGKLGVGQARPLGEQLQAGVVGDRHAQRPQHGLHGGVQGAGGRLDHVPQ
jgi:hypothetical protein